MKVMVLGGGNCQLNLIDRLKSEGDEVILVDYLSDCPAGKICDSHILLSTFDTEGVLAAAKENEIEAIVTLGTDQPIYTAAVVAEELNLPFYVTPEQALSATNKRVMKQMFIENDIPTAEYALLDKSFQDEDIKDIGFPAVLKPVDSQGQRGIYKVNSIKEIQDNIDDTLSFSREDKVLLEEYYGSDEITVNGWLQEGKFTLLSVVDRVTLTSDNHIGICIAHNFPSVHIKKEYADILTLTEKIIKAFGFKNGPVYFQYLIGDQGIKVNEIAMRIGGAYEDITLPKITGLDVLGLLIDEVKGNNSASITKDFDMRNCNKYISTQMFFLNQGIIDEIKYDENFLKTNGISFINIFRNTGDVIGTVKNATARAGFFLVEATSYTELKNRINLAYDNIIISGQNGENLVKPYSSYKQRYKFAPKGNAL